MFDLCRHFGQCAGRFTVLAVFIGAASFAGPEASQAQYPGTASGTTSTSLSGGSASASSSADNAESQSATDATASRAGSSTSDTSARNGSARNTVAGDNSDDSNSHAQNDSHSMTPAGAFGHATAATRKRALIKAFRLEFARRIVVEKASQKRANAFGATRYLDQFSDELDTGFDRPADLRSLGQDLTLLREVLDGQLDVVLASYDDYTAPRRGFFTGPSPVPARLPALRDEVQKLDLKHELLQFGAYSLQAMGHYPKSP